MLADLVFGLDSLCTWWEGRTSKKEARAGHVEHVKTSALLSMQEECGWEGLNGGIPLFEGELQEDKGQGWGIVRLSQVECGWTEDDSGMVVSNKILNTC